MSDRVNCCAIVSLAAMIVGIVVAVCVWDYQVKRLAFAEGYEQTTKPGMTGSFWARPDRPAAVVIQSARNTGI